MWVVLEPWIVGDDGLELGEGDRWRTVLEVYLGGAEVVDDSSPLSFELTGDPLSIAGPNYDVVARVLSSEQGHYLDAAGVTLTPSALVQWRDDTVLTFQSELRGGWYPVIPPPDHLIFDGEVSRLFIREWDAVPDGTPNSYRRDPQTLRTRPIQRIQTWETVGDIDPPNRTISDYLLELF